LKAERVIAMRRVYGAPGANLSGWSGWLWKPA
jgi:hypothetical protein